MAAVDSTELLLGFYGDDFTGSTDAMEALARAGLKTVLFIGSPGPEQLRRYRELQAVGVAGCSRMLSPQDMKPELERAFGALKELRPPIVHYKVCSTFDSSPEIGSIGRAMDIGAEVFNTPVVPCQVGAPVLGRYCVFGNLFARSGLDSEPFRLDRHPTMSQHPITPMPESDLRLHLAQQTRRKIGLIDILALTDADRARDRYRQLVAGGAEAVLFDVLYRENEPVIGCVLDAQICAGSSLFVVGSSGVEYSLTAYWRSRGRLSGTPTLQAGPADRALVVSGSCSPVTDRQIAWALQHGAVEVALDTVALVDPAGAAAEIERAVGLAAQMSREAQMVICHTSRGPSDARHAETVERLRAAGDHRRQTTAPVLGGALGRVLRGALMQTGIRRAVVTGGDTSSFAAQAVGIEALEVIGPVAPGCPLCRAHIPGSPLDGLEICFKGGQVGREDYFATVLDPAGAQD